jgi:hypothetical protein
MKARLAKAGKRQHSIKLVLRMRPDSRCGSKGENLAPSISCPLFTQ